MATETVSTAAVHFRNILFATDFSDYSRLALPYVADLARKFDSKVHLCHVVTPSRLVISAPEAAPFLYEAQRRTGCEELEDLRHTPEMHGLRVNTILDTGILEDALTQEIADNDIDLIVVATHGRTGVRRLVLGSSAEIICRVAVCPVLTIGPDVPGQEKHFGRILVPTDLSAESMQVLSCVREIAREFGAAITFLHVIPVNTAAHTDPRLLVDEARHNLEKALAGDFSDLKTQVVIEFGDTTDAILRTANENRFDLIAMGIRSASALGVHFSSSIAYRVMAGACCPVLTCR